ncbi:MAG TPA: hypothetical protein VGI80_00890, partial [Pyrinomonadaceae bacterium]
LVLIGFQMMIWMSLVVFAIFGYEWISLNALAPWSTQVSVALVGTAYMFGLIFDKAVGSLPYSFIIGGGELEKVGKRPTALTMRAEILTGNPEIYEILERRLNQHRLVRATVFNLALISITALVFLIVRIGFDARLIILFVVLSILFVGLSLFTGRRSAETLYFELLHAYKSIQADADGKSVTE